MKIVFRADASSIIGSGHIIRCLNLAEELKKNGADITFISRAHKGNLNELISQKKIKIVTLSGKETDTRDSNKLEKPNYQEWLGVSQEQDAKETIKSMGDKHTDWLILDHYGLDESWGKTVRPHLKNIMVIDDLANRIHDCNILLDQNYTKNSLNRYRGKIPSTAKGLFGPKFALLSPEYQKARNNLRLRSGKIKRILIYFGSTDSKNILIKVLEAFSNQELQYIFLDVIIGVNQPVRKELEKYCNSRGNIKFHTKLPHLAELMRMADLSIGAGGTTTWERFCMGLPSIVISTGENQLPATLALAQDGYHQYLGPAEKVTTEMIVQAIKFLVSSPKKLISQSILGQKLVDGMGVKRVIESLK